MSLSLVVLDLEVSGVGGQGPGLQPYLDPDIIDNMVTNLTFRPDPDYNSAQPHRLSLTHHVRWRLLFLCFNKMGRNASCYNILFLYVSLVYVLLFISLLYLTKNKTLNNMDSGQNIAVRLNSFASHRK